jgi:hypothetical protein
MLKMSVLIIFIFLLISCTLISGRIGNSPVAGNPLAFSSVTVTNGKATGLTVSWGAATDQETAASALSYKLVFDTNSSVNVDSVIEALVKSGNDVAMDWAAGATNFSVTNIIGNRSYYFNVIVKDGDGNYSVYTPRRLGEVSGTAQFYYSSTNYQNVWVTLSNTSLVYSNSGASNYFIPSIYAGTYKMFARVFISGLSSGIGMGWVSTNGSSWLSLSSSSNFQAWVNVYPQTISNIYITVADDDTQKYDFMLYGY